MTLRGVTIGDKFISSTHRKSKRVSTVVRFTREVCFDTGEVLKERCYSTHEFLGVTMTTEVPFSSVLRNKVS